MTIAAVQIVLLAAFGERLSWQQYPGIGVVAAGMILVSLGKAPGEVVS